MSFGAHFLGLASLFAFQYLTMEYTDELASVTGVRPLHSVVNYLARQETIERISFVLRMCNRRLCRYFTC